MRKKILFAVFVGLTLLSSCKKVDIFTFELPSGRVSGYLKNETTGDPVKDIYIIFTDTAKDAYHMTYSDLTGYFTMGRLASGTYSVVPANDSLYCATDTYVEVIDGKVTTLPDLLLRPTLIPVLTMNLDSSVVAKTKTSIQMRCWTDDGHSTVITRGFKYQKNSVTTDIKVSGTTKSASTAVSSADELTVKKYSTTLTSLTANTTYKIIAFVTIYRGLTAAKARKTVYIYSPNTILVTTPAV